MQLSGFKMLAQSLLKNAVLSDYVIEHGGHEYKVHKVMLACHSHYFNECFKTNHEDVQAGVTDMTTTENPEVVGLLVSFLYNFDYNDSPKKTSKFPNAMELNAAMHTIAYVYDMADMKQAAITKFGIAAAKVLKQKGDPLHAIHMAYEDTPSDDRALRDVCVSLWTVGANQIILTCGKAVVETSLHDNHQFAADIAMGVAKMVQGQMVPTPCTCHFTSVGIEQAMEHVWEVNGKVLEFKFSVVSGMPRFWLGM